MKRPPENLLLRAASSIIGGDEGGRTPDLCIANAALCQTELHPQERVESSKSNVQGISAPQG